MEHVILLDEAGHAVGTQDKATVHHAETPLHLAFSSYVFNRQGRLLLSQRAWSKKTWPGIWTNSCCGHPAPGEPVADAVRRRLRDELGLAVDEIDLVLPAFRYRAVMADGVVENEMCPVFRVVTDAAPVLNPDEVEAVRWVPWQQVITQVSADQLRLSPWCQLQLAELVALGPDPAAWPVGDTADLPPAARPVPEQQLS
ncbi:MAG TPA: isopentenyl-diphosphate Delta-isomerase [Pseudonocardiaceae bacterium]|jgi:isopentenyl-diphosphate delta-isomerase|nr:isopentenyl-diphosphate Delta-isomerase [Pseudonocardiaceae bacterium]